MLEISDLRFRYSRHSPTVLDGVNLRLGDGEIGILLGKNGSGKTTLFKNILGIEEGQCTSDGKFSLDACRCIGACGLAPVMTVNDDVYGKLTKDQLKGILDKYAD